MTSSDLWWGGDRGGRAERERWKARLRGEREKAKREGERERWKARLRGEREKAEGRVRGRDGRQG